MRVFVIGSLGGDLGQAARIAIARGAKLEQADESAAALARLRTDARVDLVLCDLACGVGGVVRALAAERMAVPVVACGTGDDPDAAVQAIRDGAREFLPLPPDPDLIAAILEAASGEAHALIVRDPRMAATVHRAEQIARSEASILITGESGTGKEVLARHIHRRSRRATGPFVALNCAAIPETLLESELFGHEKGAFSGALARRIGRFEAANRGTLLLDEIGEMDLRLQAKLLRAVQEHEIDRLGGAAPVKIDVRILATTNRDLREEVARGRFREDLYFRLNVVSLRIPALRERLGDIPALADHFARRYAEVNGLPYRPLAPEALAFLRCHAWRGNVRELENTIHRAVLLADGEAIGPDAIELEAGSRPANLGSTASMDRPNRGLAEDDQGGDIPDSTQIAAARAYASQYASMSTGQANRDAPLVTSQAYPSHESTSRPAYHSPETPALLHGVPPSYAAAARDYSGSQPVITGVGADPFTPIVHDHPAPEVSTPAKGATGVTALVGRRMEDVERDLIIETLSHTFGNRTHAATILGISIRALRNKLRDYAAQGVAVPPPAAGVAA